MPSARQLYSGRLIFDHFPKAAGQAINAWLKSVLGGGTVSPNLIGRHKELLRASGEYPIVSGHVIFSDRSLRTVPMTLNWPHRSVVGTSRRGPSRLGGPDPAKLKLSAGEHSFAESSQ